MSKVFSAADVASHNKPDDLFIIVDEDVYDVSKFADEHPGGKKSKLRMQPISILRPMLTSRSI
jgi:cytochrome b involved in lipid metabolism